MSHGAVQSSVGLGVRAGLSGLLLRLGLLGEAQLARDAEKLLGVALVLNRKSGLGDLVEEHPGMDVVEQMIPRRACVRKILCGGLTHDCSSHEALTSV